MKKIIIILLLIPTLSHAQNCVTAKDPKTGDDVKAGVIYFTDDGKVNGGTFVLIKSGGKLNLQFTYNYSNNKKPNLNPNDLVLSIKFDNNEEKKFAGNSDTRIYTSPNNGIKLNLVIDIAETDVSYFKNIPIAYLLVYHKGDESNGYSTKINSEDAKKIMKCTDCLN